MAIGRGCVFVLFVASLLVALFCGESIELVLLYEVLSGTVLDVLQDTSILDLGSLPYVSFSKRAVSGDYVSQEVVDDCFGVRKFCS
jgi:hypothetical protein